MLTPKAKDYLAGLVYNPAAQRMSNYLPLTVIYWDDEITSDDVFSFEVEDRNGIFLLFQIRRYLWLKKGIDPQFMAFWQETLAAYPECPIFKRAEVGAEIVQEQRRLEKSTTSWLDENGFKPVQDDEKK